MKNRNKTRKQLLEEIENLNNRIAELEKSNNGSIQIETEITQNQYNLSSLIENTNDLIWSIDRNYQLLTANSRFLDFIQPLYGERLFTGSLLLDKKKISHELYEEWKQIYDNVLAGNKFSMELETFKKPDLKFFFDMRYNPIYNEKGEVIGVSVFGRDITERKLAEEKLHSQAKFIDNLIESSALSTWISDENGTAIRANPACLKFFGAKKEEVIGKYNIFQDKVLIKQGYIPELKKVFENGEIANVIIDYNFAEVEHVNVENATHKIINSIFTPILNAEGKVTNAIIQTMDLSGIKKAEREIIEAKETAERYLDLAGSMFLSLDTNGNILLINQKGLEILEYDNSEELIGKNWFDTCIPQEINSEIKQVIKKVMNDDMEGVEHYDNEIITKSGERKMISWYNSYIKGKMGKTKYLLSSGVDITEINKTQIKLQESENNLRAIFNAMTDVVIEIDYDGKYIDIAPTSPDLLYKPSNDMLGKTLHDLFPKPEADKFLAFYRECLDEHKTVYLEYPLIIDNKTIWFDGKAVPKTKNTALLFARDITERKNAEDEINKYREHLEELVKERTAELEIKNKRLEDFSKLFVGREFRIKELRTKVKDLEEKLGI